LLFAVFLWGCGSGPGSPGSCNTEKTGVILSATITPEYLGTNTYSVDAFRNPDCDGDPTTDDPEPFTDHGATVTINATLLNPDTTFKPGTLYIEKYTVEYRRSTDSIGTPPIESYTEYISITIDPPLSGTGATIVTASVVFVDLTRKDRYESDMLSGQFSSALNNPYYINNYTATYTFEGKNQYGEEFCFQAQKGFQIGNFDNCGG
jgi:hypothetical protein